MFFFFPLHGRGISLFSPSSFSKWQIIVDTKKNFRSNKALSRKVRTRKNRNVIIMSKLRFEIVKKEAHIFFWQFQIAIWTWLSRPNCDLKLSKKEAHNFFFLFRANFWSHNYYIIADSKFHFCFTFCSSLVLWDPIIISRQGISGKRARSFPEEW